MEIRTSEPMSTRPCSYCLALQDDSVFVDLDLDENGCVYLVRISYDGYGCCEPESKKAIGKMDSDKSKRIVELIESDEIQSGEAAHILSEYFGENKGVIWEDALLEHGLI